MQQIWDQGTNSATAERAPVDNSCSTVLLIFQKKMGLRGKVPSSVPHISLECLSVIKNPEIRKSRHQWPNADIYCIPPSNTSCKQGASCVETHVAVLLRSDCCCPCHVARSHYTSLDVKCNPPLAYTHIMAQSTDTFWGNTICYIFITGFASS